MVLLNVATVNNIAQGLRISTIEFDLRFVFLSACLVHIGEDEGLHCVDVDKGFDEWMGRVRQYLMRQWLL